MAKKSRKHSFRVAALQINAGRDWQKNLSAFRPLIRKALSKHPDLIALPENFLWRGPSKELGFIARNAVPQVIHEFKKMARMHRVAFLLGSVIETVPGSRKFFNTTILISETGKILARYRKIHLFDVHLKKMRVMESRHILSGKQIVCPKVKGVRIGLTLCYDVRFPELYRRLTDRGCKIIFVPANFTEKTGQAHWEILLRARAIENLVFIVAPAQTGTPPESGITSFGTSLIIDPWGKVIARAGRKRSQVLFADLSLKEQSHLREVFPVLKHRRLQILG